MDNPGAAHLLPSRHRCCDPSGIPGGTPLPRGAGASPLPAPAPIRSLARHPTLLDRLAKGLRARHDPPQTDQGVRHWVKRFIWLERCHDDHE